MSNSIVIWDPLIRIIHWTLVLVFLLNYFVLESGSDLHQILGYVALAAVIIRMTWAAICAGYGSFKTISWQHDTFVDHYRHLKHRQIPAESGHNPFGWMMIMITWLLFIALAISGFMLEEVDYFFGNSLIEDIHSLLSDLLYAVVIVHVMAVFLVAWWGKVSLVRAMVTGKRKLKQ